MKKLLAVLLAMTLLCGCADDYAVSTAVTTSPEAESTETAESEPIGPFQFFTVEDIEGNEVTHEVFADADLTVIRGKSSAGSYHHRCRCFRP